MTMDQLRQSFETLGFGQVRTYIQSGNLIFKGRKQSPLSLARRIEERILADFGFSVPVITKSSLEMSKTIQSNSFLKERGIDPSKLHVTFLSQTPGTAALKKLAAVTASREEFRYAGEAVYLHCPNGYGETKLSNSFFERILSVRATTRNWRTVNKLHEMSLECA
jgi:uncharacterized protein (DUF1697 family)